MQARDQGGTYFGLGGGGALIGIFFVVFTNKWTNGSGKGF